jgi:hypothetical protein
MWPTSFEIRMWVMLGRCQYLYSITSNPSRRVLTSTWWEGLVLPMIPRAMPAGAQAPGRDTQAGKVKDEGRN